MKIRTKQLPDRHKQMASGKLKGGLFADQAGGVALVLVIWVIVVLIAIVGEFAYSMRTEINISRNFKEEEEAYQLALAGIEEAKAELLTIANPSKMYMNEDGILVFDPEKEGVPERKNDLGKGVIQYTITNEEGKLNLNTATPEQLRSIFLNSGVDTEDVDVIVDSIMDWRDTDDLHMLNGAEDDYYESLNRPYSAKDGPFDSADELLLVKGMKPDIYFGSEKKDDKNGYEGIGKYFTVYGSGRINIRTAPLSVLEAVMGPDMARNIIAQREAGAVAGPTAGGAVVSEFFSIVSTGYNASGTIRRTVKTTVKKAGNKLETVYWNDNIIG
jgi:general secretion pathway protein K